jgi:leucyl-tRNA synthetase
MAKEKYNHVEIERVTQQSWTASGIYETDLTDTSKDPYYLLFEFPYPSGDLHIGHWYAFALTDIYARMLRMQGKQVLFPVGFDAFGLPAENAAIKNNVDPREWTYANMERMRTQIRSMGTSVDWSKEVVSCDPEYYRWTQWLFSKLFELNLAERRNAPVKWCPKDQTVLANEQVTDGLCERCGTEVEEKNLTQWFLKITDYAKRLLTDLDPLPWREDIKDAQRAWIGESEGAKLTFAVSGNNDGRPTSIIEVFTTRPDTLYGVTYVVLAPEHPLVGDLLQSVTNAPEVLAYRKQTSQKTERERSENKDKTGVALAGVMAINPATKEEIPVYLADYVLASYGTGAVMAVPAHDERDYAFAQKFSLPMKQVVVTCADDPKNPPQPGFEEVKRDTVVVHLRDKTTGKFALLDWHGSLEGITTAIMGGIETVQTPEEAAAMEIRE